MAKAKKKIQNKNNSKIVDEIVGLVSLFLGFYILYSLIVQVPGVIGKSIDIVLNFSLGKASYLFGFTFILLGIYFIIKGIKTSKFVVISLLIIIINFSILITIIDNTTIDKIFSIEIIEVALATDNGGGFLGLLFASILEKLFSIKGTIIILILSTIISIILITQRSIYDTINKIKYYYKNNSEKIIKQKNNKVDSNKKLNNKNNENLNKIDKKIKILDYSEIRNKNNVKKENSTKEQNSREKYSKQIENKIEQLEKDTTKGPLKENKEINYTFPPIELLKTTINNSMNDKKEIVNNAKILEKTLSDFGVKAKVSEVSMGPTVTRYELQPEPGVKVSKIVNLSNDLALSMATSSVRIEAPIPGKAAVGIEVPNKDKAVVNVREVIANDNFKLHKSKICFALGKKLSGSIVVGDLAQMPHLLIAGATGSGKSVCINSIIISILYKASPEEVKLILIDPKMVELNNYNGIPHLLIPVVTDPKQASGALNWAIKEMTERYKIFKDNKVRDITRYNEVMKDKQKDLMPKIVIIIDELADLMMVSPREVENSICRLAQLARAAGIHLVLATQRPSVDVITGLIKANVPSRISFAVSSMTDSRTILDMGGAEKLLGRGDMLYSPVGESKPIRIQGTFISDHEVERVVKYVKNQIDNTYNEKVMEEIKEVNSPLKNDDFEDEMLPKAIELTLSSDQISTSMIQRKLRVGYSRAGRIIDEMESKGLISGPEGSKPRRVLISKEAYYNETEQTNE
ncbi:MAG: DNA translocase FtsK [Eubacteriaceae bacterium]